MLFNSIDFMLFFPLVTAVYFLLPRRIQWVWLLVTSYYFYMCWNVKYVLLIALSTCITYASGLLIGRAERIEDKVCRRRRKKLWVFISFALNLMILFFFKYFGFFLDNLVIALSFAGITFKPPSFDIMLPVGISFYTFQALSYTVDVYRREVVPERNLFRYALFVSYFPQLVAGPIERSKNLLGQLYEGHEFDSDQVRSGLLLMLWGMFQKIVIADRLAIFVDYVYNQENFINLSGAAIALATVFFAFQIYCDFAGYSNIAIGAAQVMGIKLMDNFRQPYLAGAVEEFWRRWHISLSTWFRDYLYIPLGGNRLGMVRKYMNLMITFFVSGLWHGASWNFVVWGGLNGIYQVINGLAKPIRKKYFIPHTKCGRFLRQAGRIVVTFCLVDFSWLFFRAPSLSTACRMIIHMVKNFHLFALQSQLFKMGLGPANLLVGLTGIVILISVDLFREYRGSLRPFIIKRSLPVRWMFYFGAVLAVLVLGIYGPEYDAASFIYFQF